MKKIISIIMAVAMCVALAATAFAAEYSEQTFIYPDGSTVTFEAASFGDPVTLIDEGYEDAPDGHDEILIPVVLKPGSNVTVVGEVDFDVNGITDEGAYAIMGLYGTFQNGPVENIFDRCKELDASQWVNDNVTSIPYIYKEGNTSYWLQLGEETTAEEAPSESAAPTAPTAGSTYTVQKGDCLYNIALKVYGNGNYWGLIYNANKSSIKDPRVILIGQELIIPAK